MAGMIDVGTGMKNNALSGMQRLSELEQARDQATKQMDAADAADHKSNIMGGAGLGGAAAALMFAAGPLGIAAGVIGGALLGSLF